MSHSLDFHSDVRTLSSPPPYNAHNNSQGYNDRPESRGSVGSSPTWVSKLGRALSGGSDAGVAVTNQPIASTGRGGAGNFVRSESTSRNRGDSGGFERGRELYEKHNEEQVYSTGRGGQGNLRSPSRDVDERAARQVEEEVVRRHREEAPGIFSTGRGGAGNLSPVRGQESRSRSRPRDAAFNGVSSGRGGIGNITEEYPSNLETLDEEERKKHHHFGGLFAHGRGGQGNISSQIDSAPHPTGEPNYEPAAAHSSGRGGAGNIY